MNKDTSKSMDFLYLLKSKKVEIPIIQRDYAQGRSADKYKNIRNTFLSSIKKALVDNKPLHLDFIYGEENDDTFKPLDGQQRLTTLFLLYWYAAIISDKLSDAKIYLERFTYETRVSSHDFCESLVENKLEIIKDKKISEIIEDSEWFFLSWKKDPTILGMLTMLDAIAENFNDVEDIWNLLNHENPLITFNFISLEHFGLSDDLYIKMNARGKQLTSFENFKARIEDKIKINNWERTLDNSNSTFSIKADNIWLDIFWKIAKENRESNRNNKSYDEMYMRFIANAVICSLAVSNESLQNKEKTIQKIQNNSDLIDSDYIEKVDYENLCSWLDAYSHSYLDFTSLNMKSWDQRLVGSELFRTCVENQPTWRQLALLFAQTQYISKKSKCNDNKYSDWMRVIRNILHNREVTKVEDFISAINLINEILQGADDIYAYLANNEIVSGFARNQVEEEIKKAKLIEKDYSYKELFHKAEELELCQGNVNFVIHCAQDGDDCSLDLLSKAVTVIDKNFNDINDDIRRALFCVGDGNYFKFDTMGTISNIFGVYYRRHVLISTPPRFRAFSKHHQYREYLKTLVVQLFTKNLDDIIKESIPKNPPYNWKHQLIKSPDLLKTSGSQHIGVNESEGICYLIPGARVYQDESWQKENLKQVNSDSDTID